MSQNWTQLYTPAAVRASSLRQFCQVPVWPNSSCYWQFPKQEDSRGDKMHIDPTRLLLARPGVPTFLFPLQFLAVNNFLLSLYLRFLAVFSTICQQWTQHGCSPPPPPTSCDGRKRGLYCHFQKQEETRAWSFRRFYDTLEVWITWGRVNPGPSPGLPRGRGKGTVLPFSETGRNQSLIF